MVKPWTKKAHEQGALKEKKKDQPAVEEKQVPVDEFVGSLKRLLKTLNKESENVLVVDLKRNKVVYGTFPGEDVSGVAFDVYTYNGNLAGFEGAELLRYIFKYTKSFFVRHFIGLNGNSKNGFIEIKAGNIPIRYWDLKYGYRRLEDSFGDSNNRDQIILISTDTKTRKVLLKVFQKISPCFNSKTALDAEVLENCEDYVLNRFQSLSFSGRENIYLKKDPKFVNKYRIKDALDLLDKQFLNDETRFADSSFLEHCGFSIDEINRLCNKPINLKEAYAYVSSYLTYNSRSCYMESKRGDWYYDYNLVLTAFTEYLKSTLK